MDCKPERLVCAVFVALASQPVSNERNCLFLVVAFTYFLFLPNSFIAAQQRYYGMHYSIP